MQGSAENSNLEQTLSDEGSVEADIEEAPPVHLLVEYDPHIPSNLNQSNPIHQYNFIGESCIFPV